MIFDLIVIGGGIVGTGIARDAALRGLRVALFEREDFGAGTSSRSTRLIHGGLRYLEQWDFGLVREDLRERELLLRNAPHLVRPLPFLIPFYRTGALHRLKLRAGLLLYDVLSFDRSLPGHRMLTRAATLALEPGLNSDGLQGAALYHDAQISAPERLCVENVVDAEAHGALAFNHTAVIGAVWAGEPAEVRRRIAGVQVRDRLTGAETEARAPVVVNAAGPWLDDLTGRITGQASARIRRTKGVHFAAPGALRHAVVLFSEEDERLFFLVPWLGHTWVGTTDTDYEGDPAEARATAEEIAYLRRDARRTLPDAPWDTIYFTQAGVRALVREDGKDPSAVSRRHQVLDHARASGPAGLISVLGGKLTAYRSIAEEVIDLVCRRLGNGRRGETAVRPLPGGRMKSLAALEAECEGRCAGLGLSGEQARHLTALYGTRYGEVLALLHESPPLASPLHALYPDLRAQVHHAVLRERCRTAADFLMRRSFLHFTPDQGRAALEPVIDELAGLLSWDAARCERERAEYERALALTAAPDEPQSG
jgi:glycerol-3-phosphate dehydrogenase